MSSACWISKPSTSSTVGRARRLLIEMLHKAGEGHFGGSLSALDIVDVLVGKVVRSEVGDTLILSKGHAAPALYAVWASRGLINEEELSTFGQFRSRLQGHPDRVSLPLVDFSTGSLGQGLSAGLGYALAARGTDRRSIVVVGDGECQEGQVWEAAQLAARLRPSGLVVVVDCNGRQEWGFRRASVPLPPLENPAEKWRAFGWAVIECNGHDHADLVRCLTDAAGSAVPTAVIAHTRKGNGASLIEADIDRFHCGGLTDDEYADVLEELGTRCGLPRPA